MSSLSRVIRHIDASVNWKRVSLVRESLPRWEQVETSTGPLREGIHFGSLAVSGVLLGVLGAVFNSFVHLWVSTREFGEVVVCNATMPPV